MSTMQHATSDMVILAPTLADPPVTIAATAIFNVLSLARDQDPSQADVSLHTEMTNPVAGLLHYQQPSSSPPDPQQPSSLDFSNGNDALSAPPLVSVPPAVTTELIIQPFTSSVQEIETHLISLNDAPPAPTVVSDTIAPSPPDIANIVQEPLSSQPHQLPCTPLPQATTSACIQQETPTPVENSALAIPSTPPLAHVPHQPVSVALFPTPMGPSNIDGSPLLTNPPTKILPPVPQSPHCSVGTQHAKVSPSTIAGLHHLPSQPSKPLLPAPHVSIPLVPAHQPDPTGPSPQIAIPHDPPVQKQVEITTEHDEPVAIPPTPGPSTAPPIEIIGAGAYLRSLRSPSNFNPQPILPSLLPSAPDPSTSTPQPIIPQQPISPKRRRGRPRKPEQKKATNCQNSFAMLETQAD